MSSSAIQTLERPAVLRHAAHFHLSCRQVLEQWIVRLSRGLADGHACCHALPQATISMHSSVGERWSRTQCQAQQATDTFADLKHLRFQSPEAA